jgi:hypothetical protein
LPGANSPVLKKSPPPLPPKPLARISKPLLPPKPLRINTQNNRRRGNSVSFAKELDIIEVSTKQELEDDDDDDMEIEFHVSGKPHTL